MTVEVKLFDSLDAVADDANGALDRSVQPKLYDNLQWFRRTLEHTDLAGEPLVARGKNAKGSAWLFLNRNGVAGAEALASWYTLDFGAIGDGDRNVVIAAIAKKLKGIAHIALAPVGNAEQLAGAFRAAGWKAFIEPKTENWFVRPGTDFETYWASRPSRLRNTVKRKAKKANLDVQIYREFNERAWAGYRAIYAASWKGEEGSWGFMRRFAEDEGAAGTLRLGIGSIEGEPVAAQLWTVHHGQATIHKLAYAEGAKKLSPGSILSKAMFEHVIERDSPEIIDYGTGSEPYKADWMDEVRQLYRIDLYNPRHPASWLPLAKRAISGLVRREKRG